MATEEELSQVRDRLMGLIDESRITRVCIPRPSPDVVERFYRLADMTSSVSDALDELGIGYAVPAHALQPLREQQRVCGPAITVRYVLQGGSAGAQIARKARPRLADRDLYGVGRAGDVAAFDCGGIVDASVMGSLSARWAKRLDIAACVIDGGMRDIDSVRSLGLSVWSRGQTPVTGRHRLEAIEINGCISIAGALVEPGDLIVADGTGVCVVPGADIERVIELCETGEMAEAQVIRLIERDAPIQEVMRALSADKW